MKVFYFSLFFGFIFSTKAVKFENLNSDILPSKDVCGQQTRDDTFPWFVFIPLTSRMFNPGVIYRCAGTLISKRFVLTHTSCLQYALNNIQICNYHTLKNDTCKGGPVLNVEVEEWIINEPYDTVLIKLTKEVEYTDHIRPICLPFEEFERVEENDRVYILGWKLVSDGNNEKVEIIDDITAAIINNEECEIEDDTSTTERSTICVEVDGGSKGNLHVDKGSPLIHNSNGNWVLEGIMNSFSSPIDRPAGGVRITDNVLNWIIEHIHKLSIDD